MAGIQTIFIRAKVRTELVFRAYSEMLLRRYRTPGVLVLPSVEYNQHEPG